MLPMGSEAAAGDDDGMSMVRETIQTGRGEERRVEEVGPFREVPVAGDENAALLIAGIDDVIEIFGGWGM